MVQAEPAGNYCRAAHHTSAAMTARTPQLPKNARLWPGELSRRPHEYIAQPMTSRTTHNAPRSNISIPIDSMLEAEHLRRNENSGEAASRTPPGANRELASTQR